jgi:hypothetical protein
MTARIKPVHASSDKRMANAHTKPFSVAVPDDWRGNIAGVPSPE